jgi:hypothetical protein
MERIKAAKDGKSAPPKKAEKEEVGEVVEGEESAGAPAPA